MYVPRESHREGTECPGLSAEKCFVCEEPGHFEGAPICSKIKVTFNYLYPPVTSGWFFTTLSVEQPRRHLVCSLSLADLPPPQPEVNESNRDVPHGKVAPVKKKKKKAAAVKKGAWIARLKLQPGKYLYKFVVDGAWLLNPELPVVSDGQEGAEIPLPGTESLEPGTLTQGLGTV